MDGFDALYSYVISNVYPISLRDLIIAIVLVLAGFIVMIKLKGNLECPFPLYLTIMSFMARYIGNCIRFFDPTTGTYIKHIGTICLGFFLVFCYFFYIIKCVKLLTLKLGAVSLGVAAIAHLMQLLLLRNICMYFIVFLFIVQMIIIFKNK